MTNPAAGMPCPVCKVPLVMSDRQGVEIDYCPQCRGVWLDRGELDKIIERSAQEAPPPRRAAAARRRRRRRSAATSSALIMATMTAATATTIIAASGASPSSRNCSTDPRRACSGWKRKRSRSSARRSPKRSGRSCSFPAARTAASMLHLARKAFFPARPPFPLLHVDTGWKFAELYALRDALAAEAGMDADRPPQSRRRGARHQPVRSWRGAAHRAVEDRGAEAGARRRPLRRRLRRRPARRGDEPGQGADLLGPLGGPWLGPEAAAARALAALQRPPRAGREPARLPALRLDRARRLGLCRRARGSRSPRSISPPSGRPSMRDGTLLIVDDERVPLATVTRRVRVRTVGCWPLTGAVESEAATIDGGARGDGARRHVGAGRPADRQGPARLDGAQEAPGLFLMAAAAPPPHLRLGRRRQVDPDRPAAARLRRGADGQARGARPISPCSPTGSRPSASRASPSTSPISISRRGKRRFILADMPGPRAIYPQHGDRRLERRPRHRAGRRDQGRAHPDPPAQHDRAAARHPGLRLRGEQDGPGRLRPRRGSRRYATISPASRGALGIDAVTAIPVCALDGDNVDRPLAADGLV